MKDQRGHCLHSIMCPQLYRVRVMMLCRSLVCWFSWHGFNAPTYSHGPSSLASLYKEHLLCFVLGVVSVCALKCCAACSVCVKSERQTPCLCICTTNGVTQCKTQLESHCFIQCRATSSRAQPGLNNNITGTNT